MRPTPGTLESIAKDQSIGGLIVRAMGYRPILDNPSACINHPANR